MFKEDNRLRKLLDRLIAEGREHEWLEFKESRFDSTYLGKCVSALANSARLHGKEQAYVVFGVRDNTLEVVGTKLSTQEKVGSEVIENWLHVKMKPRIDIIFHEFHYDGKKVIIIEIDPAYDRPVTFGNVAYIRAGSYNSKLSDYPEKERKIWMIGDKLGFEKQIASTDLVEDDVFTLLDWEKYFELIEQRLPSDKKSSLQMLEKKNLVSDTGTLGITNMGALLFAKDLRRFDRLGRKTVRIILYSGKGRLEAIRELEATRGYAAGFDDLIERIESQLEIKEKIGSDGFRKSIKTYPPVAIREIVANLLIHQDFSISGAGPMVEIFSNRVEFTNPGESLVDKMRVIDSAPQSRNEMLARFMRMVRLCEERGSGIDKVISAVEQAQLPPPKFVAEKNYFRVILFAPKKFKEMSREERIEACYQHCCLKYVLGEIMTNSSLRERFGIAQKNYPMAHRIITDTIDEKLVKRDPTAGESKRNAGYIPVWA